MTISTQRRSSKVPEITLLFWIIKIAATTLGETGGYAVSMSMHLGYLLGTAIFAVVFLLAVAAQIKATRFHPALYWLTVIATTTVGTTLADLADRSLGIGYAGGASLLALLLLLSLGIWYTTTGSVAVADVDSPRSELFYWSTIMFSQTLGTALGDWAADSPACMKCSIILMSGSRPGIRSFSAFSSNPKRQSAGSPAMQRAVARRAPVELGYC